MVSISKKRKKVTKIKKKGKKKKKVEKAKKRKIKSVKKPAKKKEDSPLITFKKDVAFLIHGNQVKDSPNMRFLFPPTQLNIGIYDSHIEFFSKATWAVRGKPRVEFKGILPFASVLPLKKILDKYPADHWDEDVTTLETFFMFNKGNTFQIFFDPQNGWEQIPKFFEANDPQMDRMLLKSNAEYKAHLARSFIGPYVMLSARFEDDVAIFLDVVKVLKSLDFANPVRKVDGQITISLEEKASPGKKPKKKTGLRDFRGYELPLSEAEAVEELEDYIRSELTISGDQDLHHDVLNIEKGHVIGLQMAGRDRKIRTLPDSIYDLTSLELLDLQNNHFIVLDEPIGNLTSLKVLNLYHNFLKILPESFSELKSLERLYLSDNELYALPKSIGNFKSLEVLMLEKNRLSELPESIGGLQSLEELYLEENQLTTLPESIGNLKSLKSLKLTGNPLKSLPNSIIKLESLIGLELSECQLKKLPESIGKLKSLQMLGLKGNELLSLPESIGKIEKMRGLDLRENQLKSLPESIGDFKWLIVLELQGNQLKSLPESIKNLTKLERLDLRKNSIKKLPETLEKWLRDLKKNRCKLQVDFKFE